ncbi:apolipoprotein N-acyltransferase [Nocardioides agariphilus]|jgi:apolipoprotein N-acyltransferase|uniref:Apolipoprotein N-acyltransferase n=2 Tax=Nocardioides agariphilus TaxID=433664 RepID=A0A930VSE5_9ACTN|nr:apolipoprotein N-acyltransferase [Nocardioides agariphilus]MBF4770138.1 apolipoprotein N-acyltransferase [Nocardioides agariphilus]
MLAAVAGVVLSLAYPPVGFFWVLPLAVAAYVVLVAPLPAGRAWVPGLAFGIGFCYVLMWWMRAVDPYAWLALSGLEALFYGLLGAAVPVLRRLPLWPLWVAAAWTAMEVLRSGWPFSGMPWGRLAFAVVDTPVAPALAYVGATGVSLLLAMTGATIAALVMGGARRPVAAGALVVAATALLAPALHPWQPSPEGSVRVAVVQGDVPGDGTDVLAVYRQVTDNQLRATVGLADEVADGHRAQPDFVLWPENSTAVDPFNDAQTHDAITTAASAIGVPILVGAMVDAGPDHVMNQGIVWDPLLGAGERYTKRHPVPFGEYIPWRNVFGDSFGKLDMIPRDMLSGTRREPLRIGGTLVADAICFDVAYDDGLYDQVTHGAQLVVVQTSNAMFIHTAQIEQQFEISRVRAIELGRSLAVASVNGRTGVIAADGEVVAAASPRTTAVLDAEVRLDSSVTPGTYAGHWVGRLAGPLTVLLLLVSLLGYGRRRGPEAREPAPLPQRTPELTRH